MGVLIEKNYISKDPFYGRTNNYQRLLSATLLREVGYFFPPKEEVTSLNNVMDKYRLCSRESVHNSVINYHLFIACRR